MSLLHRCCVALVLGLAWLPAAAGGQEGSAAPPLPDLAFEQLPARVRTPLQRAWRDARAEPESAARAGRLGMLLHAHGQYATAARAYQRARALEPGAFRWQYLEGVVLSELGLLDEAVHALYAAVASDDGYLPARLALGEALLRAGRTGESFTQFSALTMDVPELAAAHYGLGRVEVMETGAEGALPHLERAVALAPQYGAAHYALALAHRDAGNAERARAHLALFQQWSAQRPSPPDPLLQEVAALRTTARELIAAGARLGDAGRLQESVAAHLQALEADPSAAQAHVNLISLYGRLGERARAESHYRSALALEGSRADAHYNYGVLQASRGALAEAERAFRATLDVNPFHAAALNNLGSLLARGGRLEEAAAHFARALASDPAHRGARLNLAQALVAARRPADAIPHFERLLDDDPEDRARVRFALATAWLAAGDPARARRLAEQALREAKDGGHADLANTIERALATMAEKR